MAVSELSNLNSFIKYLEGRRYSQSTIESYAIFIGDFLQYLKDKPVKEIINRDVELFIEDVFIPKSSKKTLSMR